MEKGDIGYMTLEITKKERNVLFDALILYNTELVIGKIREHYGGADIDDYCAHLQVVADLMNKVYLCDSGDDIEDESINDEEKA